MDDSDKDKKGKPPGEKAVFRKWKIDYICGKTLINPFII
jgi:hypothetical protein